MGGVKHTPPLELKRQAVKVILLGASNVSLSEFIEEVKKFVKMFEEWEKNGE
jgi:hypothetical protein